MDAQEELKALEQLQELEQLGGGSPKSSQTHASKTRMAAPRHKGGKESLHSGKTMKKKEDPGQSWLGKFLGGEPLKSNFVQKQWGLILLCGLFAMLLVGNRYHVEKLQKEKLALEENIKYLGEHQIQMQKQSQDQIRPSNLEQSLDQIGIGYTAGPPYEI